MNSISVWSIIGGIVVLIVSIILILVVLSQEAPKGDNLSALTGSDSYFSKNQGRTKDVLLGRIARTCLVLLFIISTAVTIINGIMLTGV